MYANNISKLLQSMVDKTDKEDPRFTIDLEDDVVGRAILTHEGELKWPNPKPLPMLDAVKKEEIKKEVVKANPFTETLKSAVGTAVGLSSIIGVGVLFPDPAYLAMLTTFSLAVVAGY